MRERWVIGFGYLVMALVCWSVGWRSRELFGPAVIRHEHRIEDMPVVSSAESLVIRYEFTGSDCTVRRK